TLKHRRIVFGILRGVIALLVEFHETRLLCSCEFTKESRIVVIATFILDERKPVDVSNRLLSAPKCRQFVDGKGHAGMAAIGAIFVPEAVEVTVLRRFHTRPPPSLTRVHPIEDF